MTPKRQKPVNSFIQKQIDKKGFTNLKERAAIAGLPYTTFLYFIDPESKHQQLETARRVAKALDMTLDEFVDGLLSA